MHANYEIHTNNAINENYEIYANYATMQISSFMQVIQEMLSPLYRFLANKADKAKQIKQSR